MRKSWGLSQIELAERIGVSFQQIQKYEKGLTRISVMRLQQISDALGVNITAFFEDEGATPKVSDFMLTYTPEGDCPGTLEPIEKEEIVLLKLFRRIRNKKMREGIIRQLRGVIEIENQE